MRPFLFCALVSIGIGIADTAWSDQCQLITESQARAAASQVHVGSQVSDYCEPCGDKKPNEPYIVKSVEARPAKPFWKASDWELIINGESVDLAYTFVESRTMVGRFINLAMVSGCSTTQVPPWFDLT
jgi:hypothetical protein